MGYVNTVKIINKKSKGYGRTGVIFYKTKYYYHIIDLIPLSEKERKELTRKIRPHPTYYVRKTSTQLLDYKKFDNKMRKIVNKALSEGIIWVCCPNSMDYIDPLPILRGGALRSESNAKQSVAPL